MPPAVFEIDELEVHFPFEPYDVQKELMKRVIDCVKTGQNGLLESPTGTGKTLSLLCASLAWQRKEKTFIRKLAVEAAAKSESMNGIKAVFDPPKIIYSSRTHSQLSQAIQELKRSFYKSSKAVVLGSRDLMCIHEDVSRLEQSSAKILACHVKIHAHTCAYYNNVQIKKEDPSVREMAVVDIEDLVQKGKQTRFCPFFMSRELVKEADIVFMPYNYLLDPKLRSSHGIDLKNCVIILDEGHNIAKICEEAVSFEIRSSLIALCIVEVTRALNEFTDSNQNQDAGSIGLGSNPLTKDLSLAGMMKLKQSFLQLEEELDKIEGKPEGYLLPGDTLLSIMNESGFPSYAIPRMAMELDSISSFLTGNNHEATGCDKFGSILRVLSSNSLAKTPKLFGHSYRVFVQLEESKNSRQDFRVKKTKPAKIFNFWCFNPAVGLETLMNFGPRCIMLASGTLSPIPFLVQELMVPFPVQLSNPHIIADNQLFAGVFKTGPGNVRLSSSFQNRNDPNYLTSLGQLIVKVCSVVPKGVLVFFPSYSVMELCSKAWHSDGNWESIATHKKVLMEPRGRDLFKQVMDDYYVSVKCTNGACLMAVCRGKVSEGLDFTDDNGRAVIITGIPYSPARDPHVVAKQQYLDAKLRDGHKNTISGRVWYQLEANRALNQAVGRIIRHAHDYGAILLCDERCDTLQFQQNLSQWVQSRIKSFSDFGDGFQDLAKFFGMSVQKERVQAARLQREKNKMPSGQNMSKMLADSSGFPMSQSLYERSEQELEELYVDGSTIVEEMSSGRKAAAVASGSTSNQFKLPQKKSRSLLAGLDSIATTKRPDFNVLPINSPPFRSTLHGRRDGSFGHKRKRIKISSSNNEFCSSYSVADARAALIAGPLKREAPETSAGFGFSSIGDYWQWVKNTLEGDKYASFIKAIKKYRTEKNVAMLADQLSICFERESIPQCLEGMTLFLSKGELSSLRVILKI